MFGNIPLFKHQIGYHVYIVSKLLQKVLKLLLVQAQVQSLIVILQPYFFKFLVQRKNTSVF